MIFCFINFLMNKRVCCRLLVAKEALMPLFLLDPLLLHVVMFTSRFEDLKLWNECSEFGYETIIAILKKIEKQVIDVNSDSSVRCAS